VCGCTKPVFFMVLDIRNSILKYNTYNFLVNDLTDVTATA
jgi:hypothetical protein